jgi:long-chain acyl-CoA synthetase
MQTIPSLFIARAQALTDVVAAWAHTPDAADPFFLELDAPEVEPVPGWTPATFGHVLAQVAGLARRLSSMGVGRGVPVAIWAPTSDRWTLVDMAVQCLGGITVGIYPTLLDEAVLYQLAHSESALLIVDNDALADRAIAMADSTPSLDHILSLRPSERIPQLTPDKPDIQWLKDTAATVRVDDISTYIYTSGTTGHPKAVVLNHHNFTAVIDAARERLPLSPGERSVVFLPLAHVLQRFSQYLGLVDQTEGWFAPSIDALPETIAVARPHVLAAVPRMLEKIRAQIEAKAQAKSPRARSILDWAVSVGQTVHDMQRRGHRVGWRLLAQHKLAEQLVFSKIRAGLGGHLRLLISGGAALDPALALWFEAIGIQVREGWGLSETTAPATLNGIDSYRLGTVGTALKGTEVSIADDGEILVRGPGVFQGYLKDEEATASAFTEEGHFRTGDLGRIEDGFVRIVGRKKDILVTAGGKNIAPIPIEQALEGDPVETAIVLGDDRPYLVALLFLKGDPEEAAVQAHVADAMADFPRFEQIKRWAVLPEAPSEENGLLTPTLKLKRSAVMTQHAALIDSLYDRGSR